MSALTVVKTADGILEVTHAERRVTIPNAFLEHVKAHPEEGAVYKGGLLSFHPSAGGVAYRVVGRSTRGRTWIAERVA
jgi:hypothetical protein